MCLFIKYIKSLEHIFSMCILLPEYSCVPRELSRVLRSRAFSPLMSYLSYLHFKYLFHTLIFPFLTTSVWRAIHFSGFRSDFTSFGKCFLNSQDWVRCLSFVFLLHLALFHSHSAATGSRVSFNHSLIGSTCIHHIGARGELGSWRHVIPAPVENDVCNCLPVWLHMPFGVIDDLVFMCLRAWPLWFPRPGTPSRQSAQLAPSCWDCLESVPRLPPTSQLFTQIYPSW